MPPAIPQSAIRNSQSAIVLGIEGGGTKTEWMLFQGRASQEALLAQGALPAANLQLISDEGLQRLFSVLPREASHVGVFLAGCATEEDRARLQRVAAQAWPGARLALGSDRDSALAAAFGDGDGIVVIAGTGAAVHGRKGGRVEKAGGWGQILGDRGGGYNLAVQGLRLVLTHYDLNQSITPLAEEILRMLGLNRLSDLVGWAMTADKMSVAMLAPAIFHAARFGEPEMLATVQSGADVLVDFTRAVAQRLEFAKAPVKLCGGLFTNHEAYESLYKYRLSILLPGARAEVCRASGALGAAWLAAESEERVDGELWMVNSQNPIGPIGPIGPIPETATREAPSTIHTALPQDLAQLAQAPTEQPNSRSANLETRSTRELVDLFISEEENVTRALAECREDIIAAADLVSSALLAGGRLFYIGAGTSGRLGVLDASEIPPTFGAPPELVQGIIAGGAVALHRAVEGAEDQLEAGALAILERGVRAGDIVCGITASGRTPFVLGALGRAREMEAGTILVSSRPLETGDRRPPFDKLRALKRETGEGDEALRAAEEGIPGAEPSPVSGFRSPVSVRLPTGPEIITGSTRLKAGTATKLVLNILSTVAMIRMGRVRGNAMVDLQITNAKLRDRGVRLVSQTLGIPYEEAHARLERAGWNVRACLQADAPGLHFW